MTQDNKPFLGVSPARLSWENDDCPRSEAFEDIYFSRSGGLAETRYVFLEGNRLPEAWEKSEKPVFSIAETGFGTGLNFLVTWQKWRQARTENRRLHFISVEKFPLLREDLSRAHSGWAELEDLALQLRANHPPPLPGLHRLVFDEGNVCLDLYYGDVAEALQQLSQQDDLTVDAWYLDGFAPSRNEDMWIEPLYEYMGQSSAPATTVATFTAAGHVRRGLESAGFTMCKIPGFGSKREMLTGTYTGTTPPPPTERTPWHIARPSNRQEDRAIVIGAGLAGSHAAAALARRNWQVTVIDEGEIANGASGNLQGILYTRLSHRRSALNGWSLHSFSFATRCYRNMLEAGLLEEGTEGELCGALQLMSPPASDHPLWQTLASLPEFARMIDSEEAATLAGIPCGEALYFPTAGWVKPPAVCKALLNSGNIVVHTGLFTETLEYSDEEWRLLDNDGNAIASAPVLIIATGSTSARWPQSNWLPLQTIRGQVSHIRSESLSPLKRVICHDGYISPALEDEHCIGATFDIGDTAQEVRSGDHRKNLEGLMRALPQLSSQLSALNPESFTGRVGFRAASPDYLPIVGPVPDFERFCNDYAALRRNARKPLAHHGSFLPGLYLSTGHGSRGLTSCPLSAELLAAQICAERWPISDELVRALSPARFPIRDLSRNRL